jgi:hypothetical protein
MKPPQPAQEIRRLGSLEETAHPLLFSIQLFFNRLLQQAVALPPVKGKDLAGGRPLPQCESTTTGG